MGRRVDRRVDRREVLAATLAVHLAVAAGHGATHGLIPVALAPWQNAVVLASVFVGPVVGVALALRDHPLGVPLFAASMAAALAFGLVFHFLVENPDHVHAIPDGPLQGPFQVTAVGVLLTEALGTVVGAWYWYDRARGPAHRRDAHDVE